MNSKVFFILQGKVEFNVFRIAGEVSLWLSKLMHFPGSSSHCHDDIREGLVRTVRMVLHNTYPTLSEDGFNVLQSSPPVIYITTSTYQDAAEYICVQLGLPRSTVRFIHSLFYPLIQSLLFNSFSYAFFLKHGFNITSKNPVTHLFIPLFILIFLHSHWRKQ